MYELFSLILCIISILLITLITINPSKNNIIESEINLNNNHCTIMTPKYLKKKLNYTITILAILLYLTVLILNMINNIHLNKFNKYNLF